MWASRGRHMVVTRSSHARHTLVMRSSHGRHAVVTRSSHARHADMGRRIDQHATHLQPSLLRRRRLVHRDDG
eukprot:5646271-Prymnesium_polylepis.1